MKTHEEELKTLLEKHQQEIEELAIKYEIYNIVDIMPLVINSRDKYHLVFKLEDQKDPAPIILKIKTAFPPNGTPALITFSGKDPLTTCSPYRIDFQNYDHTSSVKIEWTNEKYIITIYIKPELYPAINRGIKNLQHIGFGRYTTKTIYMLPIIPGMGTISFYGDQKTQFCNDPEHAANFENYIFTFKDSQ